MSLAGERKGRWITRALCGVVLILIAACAWAVDPVQPMPPRGPAWLFHGPLWLVVLGLYYLGAWFFATGNDHDEPVVAEYEPPLGWSAGAIRLLWHGNWDHKCFATGVLGIAAKGGLTLGKQPDDTWVATRTGDADIPALTADERSLRAALFTFGDKVPFSRANADSIDMAELACQRALESRCAGEHPVDPALLLIPGWLIALPVAMLLFFGHDNRLALVGELFVPSLVGAIAVAILIGMIPRRVLHATRAQAFLMAVLCAVGLMGGADRADWLAGAVLLAGQVAASWWLPRQPRRDTPLLRKLRGFRWYLGTAEQQQMQARYKPSLHPELQASLLPFAMALDVEVTWNARFAGAVARTERTEELASALNPDHGRAALELLDFAQSITAHTHRASAPGG